MLSDLRRKLALGGIATLVVVGVLGVYSSISRFPSEHSQKQRRKTRTVEEIEFPFVANSSTKKYHYFDCGNVDRISSTNRVNYKSSKEATREGYSPAGCCRPYNPRDY